MEAKIRKLTETMTVLAAALNKENANPNKNHGNTNNGQKTDERPFWCSRTMGGYCHSCKFHPVGVGHTSNKCKWKKDGHSNDTTWDNQMGGSTWWQPKDKVKPKQQNHEAYKGNPAPTN